MDLTVKIPGYGPAIWRETEAQESRPHGAFAPIADEIKTAASDLESDR